MGNCMETEGDHGEEKQEDERGRRFVKANGGVSMKVVVTKEELKWLILKLKEEKGMRLEEMVTEIERMREDRVEGWKPSLDSIMEAPEMLDMDNTTSTSTQLSL
ncbi:uncharacterized protein LOC124831928 [Vigna umbellata]|uniref:uncharacterized protein LOC124831928 n=1 Tax=Vigna umbellata TaxID=87088 RepID=UPI001F5FE5F8|nr:uncharacterized protein LOC124831928 [Vigna umbellata]